MARPLRICYPGAVYHVTARGNERRPIVRDDEDRQRFVRTLASMVEEYEVLCHAWVLMGNHYHVVLETPHANVSAAIRHLNGVYTQAFNRRHTRVGHLFQGRFFGILIDKDAYLLEVCRYVVLNPVRAGLVRLPADWLWSSYRATAGQEPRPSWLTVDWLLRHFGRERCAARAAYRRFVADRLERGIGLWSEVRARMVLGRAEFLDEVRARMRDPGELDRLLAAPVRDRTSDGVPSFETVVTGVARAYGTSMEQLLQATSRPSEARQVAMYGAHRMARLTVRAIGARFGVGYSAVSRTVRAVMRRLEMDAGLRARVDASLGHSET